MIGALSLYTQRAIDCLKVGEPGDEIKDDEMSLLVGRDCSTNGDGAPNVRTAIRHVRIEHRVWWERVRGEKLWRCLDEPERVDSQKRGVRLMARRARRYARESCAISPEKLDAASKVDFLLNQIQFGLMLTGGGSQMRKRLLETKTLEDLREPPLQKLVDLMGDKKTDGLDST